MSRKSPSKFQFNPETLSYKQVNTTFTDILKKTAVHIFSGLIIAIIFIFVFSFSFGSQRERKLKREVEMLRTNYKVVNKRLEHISSVVKEVSQRDDDIYRAIFGVEPMPSSVKNAGIGGIDKYANLQGYKNSKLVVETASKIDKMSAELLMLVKSYNQLTELAKEKQKMLAGIPAIQPVQNEDLTRIASGFGMRLHPILGYRKMHYGMDFTAPRGTDIYATGNGVVTEIQRHSGGYGKHIVIDHGFGYETLYAHLYKIKVKKGQKVKRGEVIGSVGNTGLSTGPHLHYEVHRNGKPVNPVNYYFNDLSSEEYQIVLKLAERNAKSLD